MINLWCGSFSEMLEEITNTKSKQECSGAKAERPSVECSTMGCNEKIALEHGYTMGAIGKLYCSHCRWVRSQSKLAHAMYAPRDGLYETEKGTPISKLKQIKPHYKWSWKLGKAVRL